MMKTATINISLYVKNRKTTHLFLLWKAINYVVFCNIHLKHVALPYLKIILEVICLSYILLIKTLKIVIVYQFHSEGRAK